MRLKTGELNPQPASCVHWGPYPGEDGEEAEGDGRPGRVTALLQRVVLRLRHLPLVCQETEAHKPHEGPECWKEETVLEESGTVLEDGTDAWRVSVRFVMAFFCPILATQHEKLEEKSQPEA